MGTSFRKARPSLLIFGDDLSYPLECKVELILNRAMNNDEAFYPDPSKFDPTRHLSPEGEFCGEKKLADSTIFGHGRR